MADIFTKSDFRFRVSDTADDGTCRCGDAVTAGACTARSGAPDGAVVLFSCFAISASESRLRDAIGFPPEKLGDLFGESCNFTMGGAAWCVVVDPLTRCGGISKGYA